MELKPENQSIDDVQPKQVDLPVVDMPIESPVVELDLVIEAPTIAQSATAQSATVNPIKSHDSANDSLHHTRHNTDPSVSSGSPMSTSSLPLSTQTSSTHTATNAQRPGERLRQARLLKQRDLKDIAAELNISERLLTAIEADDYKSLPEPAFIRGYLRGYGRLLGLDSDSLIAQFNEIYTSATGLSSNHSLENSPLQQLAKLQTRSRKSKRWIWWLLVPVALVILFLLLSPLLKKMKSSSASPADTAQPVSTENVQYVAPTTNSPLPQVRSMPLPPITSTQSETDQLVLTLSKSSDVTVQDSTGKTLVSGMQSTEKPLILTGSSPFSITLADAPSVKLSLNNEQIDLSSYTVDGHASFRLSR